jgi:hypothetical protein
VYGRAAARPFEIYDSPLINPMQTKPTSNLGRYDINPENFGKLAHALDIRHYNTPKLFQTSMFVIWGLGLLWIPTAIGAIQTQRTAVKTIAKDTMPSVILAQRIIDAMSDIDAILASSLLDEKNRDLLIQDEKSPNLTENQKYFNKRRRDVADRLTQAARNITVEAEEPIIEQLTLNFGDYLAQAERAQAAHAKGDKATALQQYLLAAEMLDGTLIPQAHKLRDINAQQLEAQYRQSRSTGGATTMGVFLLGTLTIAALVALQLFLFIRTRRTLNPMLLGATLVALLLLLHTIVALTSTGDQLRVLKEDSYNSLLEFRLARELLYGANSDESRYLLDAANRQEHEAAFRQKTTKIFSQSDDQDALQRAIVNLQRKQPNSGAGHFTNSFNNITFPAERQPLTEMLEQYKVYMAIDQQIRSFVANKNFPAATALCLGRSNEVFLKVKKAMDDAKDINQAYFDKSEAAAMAQLDKYEIKATIALGAMATLVFLGLRPRLREYR